VEWTIVDIACGALGIILVPLYDTQPLSDCDHVLKLTNLKHCFVELTKLSKYGQTLLDNNCQIIVFDDNLFERLFLK
jgi:long-chain acyl-CoA synthetase